MNARWLEFSLCNSEDLSEFVNTETNQLTVDPADNSARFCARIGRTKAQAVTEIEQRNCLSIPEKHSRNIQVGLGYPNDCHLTKHLPN